MDNFYLNMSENNKVSSFENQLKNSGGKVFEEDINSCNVTIQGLDTFLDYAINVEIENQGGVAFIGQGNIQSINIIQFINAIKAFVHPKDLIDVACDFIRILCVPHYCSDLEWVKCWNIVFDKETSSYCGLKGNEELISCSYSDSLGVARVFGISSDY